MARRKRSRKVASSGSLDSFLDIVTNSLGLLILVALLSAFSAQGVKISLGTPIMTDADEGQEVVQFHVVNGRILPVDLKFCEVELTEFFTTADQASVAAKYNAGPLANEFHRIELEPGVPGIYGIGGSYVLTPVSEDAGDTVEDLDQEGSAFRTQIEELDAERQWVFFIVSSDSFEQFREFREFVKQQGLVVGWIPYRQGEPLRFVAEGGQEPGPDGN